MKYGEYLRELPKDPYERWRSLETTTPELLTRKHLPPKETLYVLGTLHRAKQPRDFTNAIFLYNDLCAAKLITWQDPAWLLTERGRVVLRLLNR